MTTENYYLTLTCPNRPGIVAAVSTYIFELGGDIEEAQQFDDKASKRFFMRVSFSCSADSTTLRAGFVEIAKRFDLTWDLRAVKMESACIFFIINSVFNQSVKPRLGL